MEETTPPGGGGHRQGPGQGRQRQGFLTALYFRLAFYFCLAVFGISCLAWSLPASLVYLLLPPGPARRHGQRVGQFGIAYGFRWSLWVMRMTGVLRADLRALDALRHEPGLVIAANHPTMLDAVLLISRLPKVVCITKAALWDSLFLGGGIRLAGYVRNDAPLAMIRDAAEAVRRGRQLMIFPEGSRTAVPPVDPMHRSFAVMASAARAPVQTVLIEADNPYLSKSWPLLRPPVLPLVFRVRLGRRYEVGADSQAFLERLEDYFRAELAPA
ncbi:1-acyl-sn-glycerol-3-phosphate acyltransferase [Roseococcus sp. SYP-B2431]|uniref:lysophospholipid acyltransferase family protein n=1 Tax=Roseococcus sp. SYP-B2431 TaxID=2496640 RepID=UPI0013F44E5E|nr:lysophospholipid acyltransferase family protein [Roseococcus sp. SYP-B2431]